MAAESSENRQSVSQVVHDGYLILNKITNFSQQNSKRNAYELPDVKYGTKCLFVNTVEKDGVCVCKPGFWSNDPTGRGCWPCNETCHENGWCELNGFCKCKKGYIGDGVNDCHLAAPEISEIIPARCEKKDCIVTVMITGNKKVPNQAFCRFGDKIIVQSDVFDHTAISCNVPRLYTSVVKVSVSTDGVYWSESDGVLGVVPTMRSEMIIFIIFLIICGLVFTTVLCKRQHFDTNTAPKDHDDQLIPILRSKN